LLAYARRLVGVDLSEVCWLAKEKHVYDTLIQRG
jgi:predicted TPR repeat methyltransferase